MTGASAQVGGWRTEGQLGEGKGSRQGAWDPNNISMPRRAVGVGMPLASAEPATRARRVIDVKDKAWVMMKVYTVHLHLRSVGQSGRRDRNIGQRGSDPRSVPRPFKTWCRPWPHEIGALRNKEIGGRGGGHRLPRGRWRAGEQRRERSLRSAMGRTGPESALLS